MKMAKNIKLIAGLLLAASLIALIAAHQLASSSADRLLLLVPDDVKLSDPQVTMWVDAGDEEGLHVVPMHDSEFLRPFLQKGEFAGNLPKLQMHDYGVTIIRPLIYVAEQEIRTFAEQQGFMRITCRCPVGQTSMRSKTEKLLDELSTLYPNVRENVARAALLYGSKKAERS